MLGAAMLSCDRAEDRGGLAALPCCSKDQRGGGGTRVRRFIRLILLSLGKRSRQKSPGIICLYYLQSNEVSVAQMMETRFFGGSSAFSSRRLQHGGCSAEHTWKKSREQPALPQPGSLSSQALAERPDFRTV